MNERPFEQDKAEFESALWQGVASHAKNLAIERGYQAADWKARAVALAVLLAIVVSVGGVQVYRLASDNAQLQLRAQCAERSGQ